MKYMVDKYEAFKPGVYLHYKGHLYEADHLMSDANNDERVGVHYIGLTTDGAKDGPRYRIRTWDDWSAWIHTDGTMCGAHIGDVCQEGKGHSVQRFRYLGPFYMASMHDEKV